MESKNCGLKIGASGKSWEDDEFFIGNMDDVSDLVRNFNFLNQHRMIFAAFSVDSEPISFRFCKATF